VSASLRAAPLFAINYGACADPDAAVAVAQHAEEVGFESVWAGEHFVLPTGSRSSPGSATLPRVFAYRAHGGSS
jgi:alkanesulfonate monooxygenase SsuD/methylene tetrahydromethanopterin reductase-like flavin-dependent oxidoreductase (luciferase family)